MNLRRIVCQIALILCVPYTIVCSKFQISTILKFLNGSKCKLNNLFNYSYNCCMNICKTRYKYCIKFLCCFDSNNILP